eukprot:PhF_6_TR8731/c0_g1_i1/m.13724
MSKVPDFLRAIGFEEYLTIFESNGFVDIEDIVEITDAELEKIGITKLGHRKKFLRVVQEWVEKARLENGGGEGTTNTGGSITDTFSDGNGPLRIDDKPHATIIGGGDTPVDGALNVASGNKIIVEIISANIVTDHPELKPYVKAMICKQQGGQGIPIDNTKRKTAVMAGDHPIWNETHEFATNFQDGYFLVMEIKHIRGGMSANKRIGLVVIPMRFFHPFTNSTVVDNWFSMKLVGDKKTGELHLKLRVPGGVPEQTGKAYRVTGVKMDTRKLIVSVLNGTVPPSSNGEPKSTYVKILLSDNELVCGSSKVAKSTTTPNWEEDFTFFAEIKNTKFLVLKLKESRILGKNPTLGMTNIPLMFFLSQKDAPPVEQWYTVQNEAKEDVGKVRIRLSVAARDASEVGRINRGRSNSVTHQDVKPLVPPHTPPTPAEPPSLSAVQKSKIHTEKGQSQNDDVPSDEESGGYDATLWDQTLRNRERSQSQASSPVGSTPQVRALPTSIAQAPSSSVNTDTSNPGGEGDHDITIEEDDEVAAAAEANRQHPTPESGKRDSQRRASVVSPSDI